MPHLDLYELEEPVVTFLEEQGSTGATVAEVAEECDISLIDAETILCELEEENLIEQIPGIVPILFKITA